MSGVDSSINMLSVGGSMSLKETGVDDGLFLISSILGRKGEPE